MQDLKLQQMDVKGAYLNGTLHETIYMQQLKGCEDEWAEFVSWLNPYMGQSNLDTSGIMNLMGNSRIMNINI